MGTDDWSSIRAKQKQSQRKASEYDARRRELEERRSCFVRLLTKSMEGFVATAKVNGVTVNVRNNLLTPYGDFYPQKSQEVLRDSMNYGPSLSGDASINGVRLFAGFSHDIGDDDEASCIVGGGDEDVHLRDKVVTLISPRTSKCVHNIETVKLAYYLTLRGSTLFLQARRVRITSIKGEFAASPGHLRKFHNEQAEL